MIADEIERLMKLHDSGALTEDEFQRAKARVLNGIPDATVKAGQIHGLSQRTWLLLMHVSQLLTFSFIGVVAPIVMWAVSKDESADADRHGKMILNWIISSFLYAIISALLTFAIVGIPMLIVLAILHIVFPVVGAIKANSGILWHYPLSINFFVIDEPDSISDDRAEPDASGPTF